MTCNKPIDPDLDDMRECGDEGDLCFTCRCAEYDYWRNLYDRERKLPTSAELALELNQVIRDIATPIDWRDRADMLQMREKDAS